MLKLKVKIFIFIFMICSSIVNAQVYSYKDIINMYDPFMLTFNECILNTNDEDFKEHQFVIVITITAGSEKIIKFFYKEDITVNAVKNYDDIYWAINFTLKRNNIILLPAFINLPSKPNSITIKLEGYSNVNESDIAQMSQLPSNSCYTTSTMYYYMDQAYKYLSSSPDVNRPNNNLLVSAEVLQQNLSKRSGIFYLGNPTSVDYAVPHDPKKVIGANVLIQGKRTIESKVSLRSADQWIFTATKLSDVKLVQNEPYYTKIKGVFKDLTSLTIIPADKREGYLARAQEIITDDLVIGKKAEIYMNDQVVKQFTNLMNLLRAGVRVKSDTNQTTTEFMQSPEREALSFFETNIRENDYNLDNQYIFEEYIEGSVSRGILLKEIDLIRRYYQIK